MQRVCLQCGQPANLYFFARRIGPNGREAVNLNITGRTNHYGHFKDHLKHDRYRYACRECFPSIRAKLQRMGFRVDPPHALQNTRQQTTTNGRTEWTG